MTYYKRLIDTSLVAWKERENRKTLLLRGARQVGKSWAIRHLGESFEHYIEVNFEKRPEIKRLFEEISDVHLLTQRLSTLYNIPIVPGQTLLFLDEIQSCPQAIQCLWRFKEDFPELHVAAAGSLLEFALKELPSFGVGRITSLFMYPMSFDEFLTADGKSGWVEAKKAANPLAPLFSNLHDQLVEAFRTYLLVGGMPASVAAWAKTHDYQQCADELDDIRQSYYDDFAKYAGTISPSVLRDTLYSIIMQTGKRFIYTRVDGEHKSKQVKEALKLLVDAGLSKRVNRTPANGLPLGADVDEKFRKYIYLDTGLLLRSLDMELGGADSYKTQILTDAASELVNRGGLAEMVAGWEMVKYGSPKAQHDLYYWENTNRGTTSEVDYILVRNLKVLPLEVKSGTSGKMKSLRLFMAAKNIDYAIRSSLENFGRLKIDGAQPLTIDIVPLYALSNLSPSTNA